MMSSTVPVVPKKTSGPRDLRLMPTGIATNVPRTENTHVPSALHQQNKNWNTKQSENDRVAT